MEALREVMHLDSNHLHLDIKVPHGFAGRDVEILVVPLDNEVKSKSLSAPVQKRTFGAFENIITMSDDFDDELSDDYWLGK